MACRSCLWRATVSGDDLCAGRRRRSERYHGRTSREVRVTSAHAGDSDGGRSLTIARRGRRGHASSTSAVRRLTDDFAAASPRRRARRAVRAPSGARQADRPARLRSLFGDAVAAPTAALPAAPPPPRPRRAAPRRRQLDGDAERPDDAPGWLRRAVVGGSRVTGGGCACWLEASTACSRRRASARRSPAHGGWDAPSPVACRAVGVNFTQLGRWPARRLARRATTTAASARSAPSLEASADWASRPRRRGAPRPARTGGLSSREKPSGKLYHARFVRTGHGASAEYAVRVARLTPSLCGGSKRIEVVRLDGCAAAPSPCRATGSSGVALVVARAGRDHRLRRG